MNEKDEATNEHANYLEKEIKNKREAMRVLGDNGKELKKILKEYCLHCNTLLDQLKNYSMQ